MMKKPKAPKEQKISNSPPPLHLPSSPALPPLPNEVVVSILARISKSYYRSLCLVSKSFYALLSSPEINTVRTEIGATEPRLYLYLRLPKPEKNRWFTLFDKVGNKLGLAQVRVRLSSSYAPGRLNSTSVAVGSEIYQIGGGKYSKAVRVFDCRSNTWRRAPRLTVGRKNAESCYLDGKIYVIGGRREDESMIWGEVFDIKTQIWKPLPSPVDDNSIDLNLQVVVLEGRLNVITKQNEYVYDMEQGRWLRDVLFVDIPINKPFCVIDDVIFALIDNKFKWYNSRYGKWSVLENLDVVYLIWKYATHSNCLNYAIQLVNHGGKLVIIWRQWRMPTSFFGKSNSSEIWCAVIRLEKRLTPLGTQIRGEVERCSTLLEVPKSHKLLSCLSVSL